MVASFFRHWVFIKKDRCAPRIEMIFSILSLFYTYYDYCISLRTGPNWIGHIRKVNILLWSCLMPAIRWRMLCMSISMATICPQERYGTILYGLSEKKTNSFVKINAVTYFHSFFFSFFSSSFFGSFLCVCFWCAFFFIQRWIQRFGRSSLA